LEYNNKISRVDALSACLKEAGGAIRE